MRIMRTVAVLTAVVLATGSGTAPAAAAAPGDGWTTIVNVRTGLRLAVSGSRDDNGAPVIQWTHSNYPGSGQAMPEQDWQFQQVGSHVFAIRNAGTPGWKALAIPRNNDTPGVGAIQWTYTVASDQMWERTAQGRGYALRNQGTGLCLAIANGERTPGLQAIQWPCNGRDEQTWDPVDN